MIARRLLAVACFAWTALAFPVHAQTPPAAAPPASTPPAAPTTPPAPGVGPAMGSPAPAPGYPPGYPAPAYPPGYPAPAYPPGYPAPAYPPGYPAPSPYSLPAAPPREDPGEPSRAWRLGLGLALLPMGTLSYALTFRGEAILANRATADSAIHLSPFLERDLGRYVFAGVAMQYLRPVRWKASGTTSGYQSPFSGSGSEYDFLFTVGAHLRPRPRTRLFAYAAPGYAIVEASNLVDGYANTGKPHGFLLQGGGGLLHTLNDRVFLKASLSYQHTWAATRSQSYTTQEYADVALESGFLALAFAMGMWL